jgi:hypothetical protein
MSNSDRMLLRGTTGRYPGVVTPLPDNGVRRNGHVLNGDPAREGTPRVAAKLPETFKPGKFAGRDPAWHETPLMRLVLKSPSDISYSRVKLRFAVTSRADAVRESSDPP